MRNLGNFRWINHFLVSMLVVASIFAGNAHASMISTDAVINAGTEQYNQQQLQTALESEELRQQLQELGVDTKQLNDRIASLTAEEIQQLNADLEQQPAGGIVGVLLTIFIVFVITDMLCATDVFTFVRCIN